VRLAGDAESLREALQIEFLSGQLAEVVATDYDLGEVLRVEQILGGTEPSFAVSRGRRRRHPLRAQVQHGTVGARSATSALVRYIGKGLSSRAVFETKKATRGHARGASAPIASSAAVRDAEGEDKYS
jgi:hypothetical protein